MNRPVQIGIVCAVAATWVTGCQLPQHQTQARRAATERWKIVRAEVKARLAADQLEVGNIDTAAAQITKARELDPGSARLQVLHARVLTAEGKPHEALRLLEAVESEGAVQAEAYYLLGILHQQRLRWDGALSYFLLAMEADPSEVAYVTAAVQVLLQLGEHAQALELLRGQEERFGWMAAYHAALAEVHEQTGQWAAAANAWQRVADADSDAGVSTRLALALFRAERFAQAIPVLERALRETQAADDPMLRTVLGECYFEIGNAEAARQHALVTLRAAPEDPRALRLLALVLAREGAFEAAARTAERALRARPHDTQIGEFTAALAYRAGHVERAIELAQRLSQAAPADGSIVSHILHDSAQKRTGRATGP